MKTKNVLAVCLCASLLFSCSFFDKSKPDDEDEQSSSSLVRSSSSAAKSSSSRGEVEPGGSSSSDDDVSSSSSSSSSRSSVASSSSSITSSSSDDDDDDDDSSSSITPSSSSSNSSSSVASTSSSSSAKSGSSSSKTTIIYGDSVTYEDVAYPTVKIGNQIWMAKNLNFNKTGSKCWGEGVTGVSADSSAKNCEKYGRLYDWATAMDLPPRCNSSSCAYLMTDSLHQGICPDGWHIPSDADWNTLAKRINPSCTDNTSCAEAGIRLMATSGWGNASYNGHDTYGFAALPSGYCLSATDCRGFGSTGSGYAYWWSTTESASSVADYRSVSAGGTYLGYGYNSKSNYQSIRCLKDD